MFVLLSFNVLYTLITVLLELEIELKHTLQHHFTQKIIFKLIYTDHYIYIQDEYHHFEKYDEGDQNPVADPSV